MPFRDRIALFHSGNRLREFSSGSQTVARELRISVQNFLSKRFLICSFDFRIFFLILILILTSDSNSVEKAKDFSFPSLS